MEDLKNWLKKREKQAAVSESVAIPNSVKHFLFSLDQETHILIKSFLQEKLSMDLEEVERLIKNPTELENLVKSQSSGLHKKIAEEKLFKNAKQLCEALYYLSAKDLNKAIDPKDFKENIVPHIHKNGKNIVSHKNQMQQFSAHPEYLKMLKDPSTFKAIPFQEGISAKMIHKKRGYTDKDGDFVFFVDPEKHSTFMTKPYHPINDEAELTRFPLHGWATVTTKALFNAGKIGHLAEDVGLHEHEGHPVTVHKFNNKADQMATAKFDDHDYDPLEVHQIGTMDYLANNLDRHQGNLMVYKDKADNSHLMGIDHERNFVYQDTLDGQGYDAPETMFGYSALRGLEHPLKESNLDHPVKPLLDWWKKHGMNIQKEFTNQTSSIVDPAVRKHVYDNFMSRWERMDDWVKNTNPKDSYRDLHGVDTFDPAPIKQFKQPINQKILKALPKKPRDAISALYDVANRPDQLNVSQADQVTEALKHIVSKMSPEEIADVYKTSLENPHWDIFGNKQIPKLRSIILDHLLKPEEYHKNKPLYKLNHIKAIADTIDSLPEEHNKGLIQKQQAKKLRALINKVTRRAA
jgi:hypothetical protein